MRKLLIFITVSATYLLSGCSSVGDGLRSVGGITTIIPDALDKAPLIYRPTIQQGNVVTQEQVNQLEPGMTKRQVRFLLGTPMLTDIFHANRWDYTYTLGAGSKPSEQSQVTVFFEDDRLTRITGDLRPQPPSERVEVKREIVVSVPDYERPAKTLWERALGTVGFDNEE